jgi:dTDP-4-amino-4,6-dideoxygalactose transaminase
MSHAGHLMQKYKIPLFKVFMDNNVACQLTETLHSGFIGQGKKVEEFENVLSNYFGTKNLITLNSATSGIHLALHMIKNHDKTRNEVITTPMTCVATNFPILANNLKIKWADVERNTCNIDLDDVKRKINSKTLAIIVVHWAGNPCNLEKINRLKQYTKKKFGKELFVIEDCAHALGSFYKQKPVGNSENFCVFSFQSVKHITCGDGGVLISPSNKFYEQSKLLRWYGRERNEEFKPETEIKEWGFKFHMNDIAATIGIANFRHLSSIVKKNNQNYNWLTTNLKNEKIKVVKENKHCFSSSWIMTIFVKNRDKFIEELKLKGIQSSVVHTRNDKYKFLKKYKSKLKNTNYVSKNMCCIPCGWWLSAEDLEHIKNTINNF